MLYKTFASACGVTIVIGSAASIQLWISTHSLQFPREVKYDSRTLSGSKKIRWIVEKES